MIGKASPNVRCGQSAGRRDITKQEHAIIAPRFSKNTISNEGQCTALILISPRILAGRNVKESSPPNALASTRQVVILHSFFGRYRSGRNFALFSPLPASLQTKRCGPVPLPHTLFCSHTLPTLFFCFFALFLFSCCLFFVLLRAVGEA